MSSTSPPTKGERKFEAFCLDCSISCLKVETGSSPTPDYTLTLVGTQIAVEVKDVGQDEDWPSTGTRSKEVGERVRKAIRDSSKQLRWSFDKAMPGILLLYEPNSPSMPWHLEDQDIHAAMYGDHTVRINRSSGNIVASFLDRNSMFKSGGRSHFSGVARLTERREGIRVQVFPNQFAKFKLDTIQLPSCFELVKPEITLV